MAGNKKTGSFETRNGHVRTRNCSHPNRKKRQEEALNRLLKNYENLSKTSKSDLENLKIKLNK